MVVLGQEVEPKFLHAGAGLWDCSCLGSCSALGRRLAPQGGQRGQLAELRPLWAPCTGRLGYGCGVSKSLGTFRRQLSMGWLMTCFLSWKCMKPPRMQEEPSNGQAHNMFLTESLQ